MNESIDSDEERFEEGYEERASNACAMCSQVCQECGVGVLSWKDFPAWLEFVEGKIEENQLAAKAKSEMEQFSKSFGKYVVMDREEDKPSEEEDAKRKRAKQANRIYRQVCREAGMSVHFFHDFISWSDYIEGRIDDAEFYRRAKLEIDKIALQESQNN